MSVSQVLLQTLNDQNEPLEKRLKLAHNAFSTTQIQIRGKEALILQWALSAHNHPQINDCVVKWVTSAEFKQITLNDITNEDIATITKLVQNSAVRVQAVVPLCNNQVFQQFFKYNPKEYCELLASSAKAIDQPDEYGEFIKNPVLWPQSVLTSEGFAKLFIEYLYPVLVEKYVQFKHDPQVFNLSTRVIDRGILQGKPKHFTTFLDKLLEGEHEDITVAKSVFKYLESKLQHQDVAVYFKLFYSAFCDSFKDPNYPFKCLLLLTHLLKLDSSANFTFNLPWKVKSHHTPLLSQTLNTILELLDVLSAKSYQDYTIPDHISLSEFLRNFIKSLTSLNPTVLQIILKCITINPLIIEPVASNLVVFMITHNHSEFRVEYDTVIVAIFEVFSKLHRVENFIAKLIPALKTSMVVGNDFLSAPVYQTKAVQDLPLAEPVTEHKVQEMLTHAILDYMSHCIIGLASWQVINVFKSLLHHLRNGTDEFADGKFPDDSPGLVYMEILGMLTSTLLQSIKIADHTVAHNVVVKFVDGLEELRTVLKDFSGAILKRPHNHITMRTFLSLAYMWAEVYITLTYYSMNKVTIPTVSDYSGDSLTYLHSYLTRKEWQLIEQRITNFGKSPCVRLLQKLYLQKLHAMLILEEEVKQEAISNVVKWLPTHLKASWQDFLEDKFAVRVLLKEIDKPNLIFLGENVAEHFLKLEHRSHVTDSALLTNVTLWVLMGKINKLFRLKRKRDSDHHSCSEKVFKLFPEDAFLSENAPNTEFNPDVVNELFKLPDDALNLQSKEEKLLSYLETVRMLPFMYSHVQIQQMVLVYLLALTKDVVNCSSDVKSQVEIILIGVLQTSKWPLTKVIHWDVLIKVLLQVDRYELVFSLLVDNMFRHDEALNQMEPLITHLVGNLGDSRNLNFALVILQAINKTKKSKLPQTTKDQLTEYKNEILTQMSKLVCKSTHLVEAYAICLKHSLTTENDNQSDKLLKKLPTYLDYCFSNASSENRKGCAILFTLVLEKRTQIPTIPEDISTKIWAACKGNQLTQDYTHLVNLIVCSIPNEEFGQLVDDLVQLTLAVNKQLKTWESVISCDVNPVKMKTLQKGLERVLQHLQGILREESVMVKDVVHLQHCIIQTQHFILSHPIIDVLITTPVILISKNPTNFSFTFNQAVSLLELLLKHRNPIVMDRLPAFLQQYRVLLQAVSSKSNADLPKLDVKAAGDCVHRLEKLTKNLVANRKDMSRIAVFLIADILERYEQINLYPNVKLHLNNCVYALISVCDHHAVSYLMRALTRASTEMFKLMYEHYKKYYMFTGKV